MQNLRSIPEDKSDAGSAAEAAAPRPQQLPSLLQLKHHQPPRPSGSAASNDSSGDDDSSTGACAASSAKGSLVAVSDAPAVLAGETTETDSVVAENGAFPSDHGTMRRRRNSNSAPSSCCGIVWTRRNMGLFTAGVTLLVGVLSAIIAVVLVDNGSNSDNNNSVLVGLAPTPPPTFQDPVASVEEILDGIGNNTAALLDDPDSPPSRARQWILLEDQLRDTALRDGPDRVRQRYALAEFYFATGGDTWNMTSDGGQGGASTVFLDPTLSECDWMGVVCAGKLRRRWRQRRHRALQQPLQSNEAHELSETAVVFLFFNLKNVTGSLPEVLGTIATLSQVDLSHNALTGTIPASLLQAWSPGLTDLDLSLNRLTGSIPTEIGACSTLQWLDLSVNALTGSIPRAVWSLPKLRFLYLNQNGLTGTIEREEEEESELFNDAANGEEAAPRRQTLQQVLLFNNSLTGSLPTWFSDLHDLEYWVAFRNQFTGPLPDPPTEFFYQWDMSFNSLTGTLPASLWSTVNAPPFRLLILNNNQLSGPIPNATILRQDMEKLSLQENLLTGPIPADFAVFWKQLSELRVQGSNEITGQIGPAIDPTEVSEAELNEICLEIWPERQDFKANCLQFFVTDDPPVRCDCCTECV